MSEIPLFIREKYIKKAILKILKKDKKYKKIKNTSFPIFEKNVLTIMLENATIKM